MVLFVAVLAIFLANLGTSSAFQNINPVHIPPQDHPMEIEDDEVLGGDQIGESKKDKECMKTCMAAAVCETLECTTLLKKNCKTECCPGKDLNKKPGKKDQIRSRKRGRDDGMKGGKNHGPGKRGKKGGKLDHDKSGKLNQDREMRGGQMDQDGYQIEESKKDKECMKTCMATAECGTLECSTLLKKNCKTECCPGKDLNKEPGKTDQIHGHEWGQDERMRNGKNHGPGKRGKKGGKPDHDRSGELDQDREMRGGQIYQDGYQIEYQGEGMRDGKNHGPGKKGKKGDKPDCDKKGKKSSRGRSRK